MNTSTFIQLFWCEGVCRIAVPLFFIFSGYLFFCRFDFSTTSILTKYRKRVRSLLIPYLFWSAGTFLFFYIAQSIPATALYFSSRPVVGVGIEKSLEIILLHPLNSPLWFLCDLIILSLLAPLIYVLMKKLWFITLPLACFCGLWGYGFLSMRGSALCAFSLGVFLAVHSKRLPCIRNASPCAGKAAASLGILWLGVVIFKTYYLCTLPASVLLTGHYTRMLQILADINIIIGIPAMWFLYDRVTSGQDRGKIRFSQYAMMVYVMHHPLIAIIKKLLMMLGGGAGYSLASYFLAASLTLVMTIAISAWLKKYCSGFYSLISGGR